MRDMGTRAVIVAAAWIITATAATPATRQQIQQRAQTLCAADAMDLCADVVDDDAKAAACMRAHQAELHPACRDAIKAMGRR